MAWCVAPSGTVWRWKDEQTGWWGPDVADIEKPIPMHYPPLRRQGPDLVEDAMTMTLRLPPTTPLPLGEEQ